jgi:hypothetical protein
MKMDITFNPSDQLIKNPVAAALELVIEMKELQDLESDTENIAALLRLLFQAHGFDADLHHTQVIQMIRTGREECPDMDKLRIVASINDEKEIGLNFSPIVEDAVIQIFTWKPEVEIE